jgi:hypothetical protein
MRTEEERRRRRTRHLVAKLAPEGRCERTVFVLRAAANPFTTGTLFRGVAGAFVHLVEKILNVAGKCGRRRAL